MIREIWPDELEERALQIAWRESNYQPGVYNGWCCYGVFQIYWTVHRSWLDDYGITSSNDLLDARKNIQAAYGLYQRSGGFGPWGG
ncbi:MAG TPA: transglycosylase SLT domain-containing protein [Ilumatobacter sp.]|nr:transglycosylase SLT domain-containing protein [Ilumatobacter sp.]